MDCEKIKYFIQEFHDGELDKSKESFIFTHLSICEDCRGFLKSLNILSLQAQEHVEEIPTELEERIYYTIKQTKIKYTTSFFYRRVPAYVVYAMVALIILFAGYLFKSTNEYKNDLHNANELVQKKDKEIQLILNSLDEIEIKTQLKNEIIVTTNL